MLVWLESWQRGAVVTRYALAAGTYFGTGSGRNNGPYMGGNNGNVLAYPQQPTPSGNVFIAGGRFKGARGSAPLVATWNGATQVGVSVAATGAISVVAGSTLATSPAGLVTSTEWYYLAVKFVIDAGAGTTLVYLNGVEIPALTLTGQNTKPQAGGLWNSFTAGGATSFGIGWHDLYVADGTDPSGVGADLCDLVPELMVDYRPGSGNGYISQFVNQGGNSVNNYQSVDDAPPDDDTTYVQSAAAALDAYTKAAVPVAGATVIGAAVYARARKTDAGIAVAKVGMRSGTINKMSDAQALAIGYDDVYGHVAHDPNDGAWTEASFNAAEIVVEKA